MKLTTVFLLSSLLILAGCAAPGAPAATSTPIPLPPATASPSDAPASAGAAVTDPAGLTGVWKISNHPDWPLEAYWLLREDGSFTFSPHPDGSSPSQSGKYSFADGLLLLSDDFCPQPGSYRVIREAATLTLELVEDDCTRRTRAVTSTAAELYSAELIAAATPQREPTATFAPTPVPLPVAESIDVPYTSQRNLDIFAPQQPGGWPVVVILHGGGISKKGVSGLGRTLAGRGAVVFAPDWHSTESTVLDEQQRPVGFEDAACAVRFARAKAPEYGGDPSHLVVVGHSAGGASGAAITLAGDDFQGDCLVEGGSALPDAFVGLDGAYELPKYASPSRVEQNPEAWQTVNPYTYVNRGPIRNGVRFYLYAGSEQELVGDAQRLAAALQAAGYPAMFKEFPGTDHMSMATSRPDLVLAIMEAVEPGGAPTEPEITFRGETCTYRGPEQLAEKFTVSWNVEDNNHPGALFILGTLDEDKTFQDLLSMPAVDPHPAWFHVLGRDFTPTPGKYTKEIDLSVNAAYAGEPIYFVCFLPDVNIAIGAAGPFEVQR